MNRLYLDCDGVLADFDTHFEKNMGLKPQHYEDLHGAKRFWKAIREDFEYFFEELPLMHDAMELFGAVEHLRPIILTGCPKGTWSQLQKLRWADRMFTGTPMITCRSRHKNKYCKPGDILVDDLTKYKHLWEETGGVFVHHTDAKSSIEKLKELGVI